MNGSIKNISPKMNHFLIIYSMSTTNRLKICQNSSSKFCKHRKYPRWKLENMSHVLKKKVKCVLKKNAIGKVHVNSDLIEILFHNIGKITFEEFYLDLIVITKEMNLRIHWVFVFLIIYLGQIAVITVTLLSPTTQTMWFDSSNNWHPFK